MTQFSEIFANKYPEVLKYNPSTVEKESSVVQLIINDVIRPVWRASTIFAKNNPRVVNITNCVNYGYFKNYRIKVLLTGSIS
jgi:hypothetical protein